jgi:alpha-tubulin suppressor-like RCC1 family protein
LFSWGAGECGQLGTGRCTKKPIPSEVVFDKSITISDIACGSGHSLALVTSNDNSTTIYGWGLNKCGQLGLGDTKTRLEPSTVESLQLLKLQKIYASIHSSAAIDSTGSLHTWGSLENNRLMHTVISEKKTSLKLNMNPIDHYIATPKVVTANPLKGVIVNSFCFSKKTSALLVLSTAYKVY